MENYKSAKDFRRALEDRLKVISTNEKTPLDRLRRRVAFDRFLARLFNDENPKWLLKGGYAIEFRLQNIARATKDIDFSIPSMSQASAENVLALLQKEAKSDLDDGFVFFIGTPMADLDQAVYGGWRYPVEARLDNRTFTKFHLDVGVGDAVVSEPEWRSGPELLSFAGIQPAKVALLPKEQHFAEKIHAYSYSREERPNSRTRDLVDLVLLIEQGLPDKQIVKQAIQATFERRKSHPIPGTLNPPSEIWRDAYADLAADCGVTRKDMDDAFVLLDQFWREIYA